LTDKPLELLLSHVFVEMIFVDEIGVRDGSGKNKGEDAVEPILRLPVALDHMLY
jgi:hypothetical protein